MNFQFLKYDATPGEKHLGVATVKVEAGGSNFILRFKIVPKKEEGFFIQAAAHKIGDRYVPSFALDSSYEASELTSFVESSVKPLISQKPTHVYLSGGSNITVSSPVPDFGDTSNLPF